MLEVNLLIAVSVFQDNLSSVFMDTGSGFGSWMFIPGRAGIRIDAAQEQNR
jgi:hypothetical protein